MSYFDDMIFLFMKGNQEKAIKLQKKYELLISKLRLIVKINYLEKKTQFLVIRVCIVMEMMDATA